MKNFTQFLKSVLRFLLVFLISHLVFGINTNLFAQIFDPVESNYPGCTFVSGRCHLPMVNYEDNIYSFLIPVDPAINPSEVTFSVSHQTLTCTNPEGIMSNVYIENTGTESYIKVNFEELCFMLGSTYYINFTITGTEIAFPPNSEDKDFYIEFTRNPIKAMLVLDKSESMSQSLTGGTK